eukprot:667336-Hanusia_phi.AAC.3
MIDLTQVNSRTCSTKGNVPTSGNLPCTGRGTGSSKQDYIYEDEINGCREDPRQKVYVQDRVSENSELLVDLIVQGAYIYVCGSTSMAKEVKRAFVSCFKDNKSVIRSDCASLLTVSSGTCLLQRQKIWFTPCRKAADICKTCGVEIACLVISFAYVG